MQGFLTLFRIFVLSEGEKIVFCEARAMLFVAIYVVSVFISIEFLRTEYVSEVYFELKLI